MRRPARQTTYPMSQETVDVARRWFDRLQAGDPGAELCSPDIEIRNWAESPVPGPYHGRRGLRKWWREVNDADIGADLRMFCLEEIIEIDEHRVVTIQRARGRGRYTQIEIERPWGSVITVRQGKVVSALGYGTPDEAKQAAGLNE